MKRRGDCCRHTQKLFPSDEIDPMRRGGRDRRGRRHGRERRGRRRVRDGHGRRVRGGPGRGGAVAGGRRVPPR
eukprot:2733548-Prymnesium_polylepis.1